MDGVVERTLQKGAGMTNKEIISSLRGLIGKYNLTDEEWQTVEKTIKVLSNSDEDCISRAELIGKTVKKNSIWLKITDSRGMNLQEIIDELPSIQPKPIRGDAISREEVCKYIREFINHEYATDREREMVVSMIAGIQHIQSIHPNEKTVHWIEKDGEDECGELYSYWECSECGRTVAFYLANIEDVLSRYPYCHCGAKMEGATE